MDRTCHSGDRDAESEESVCLLLGAFFERAAEFDLIHNHLDHIPLSYSGLISTPILTTIHDLLPDKALPVYRNYDGKTYYVSVSDAHRSPDLTYVATVHHGVDPDVFQFRETSEEYLLFLGPIREENGTREAIKIARLAQKPLIIAGTVEDEQYFEKQVKPYLDEKLLKYVGEVDPDLRITLIGGGLALLYPVNLDEPFALSAVQANACGTPVIAAKGGSLPEIITEGVNGFLVTDISGAVDAVNRVERISRADCRKAAEERFSVQRMANDYLKAYSLILDMNKREDHRPWGYYEVLSDRVDHKVKRIVVFPGRRLSLQRHRRRAERWTIISGSPMVTRFDEEIHLVPGQSIEIPQGAGHRMYNPGESPVVFIEVQVGDYFGEDDIERIEDDFGRV
ncbi:MAG: glycosyltransferase [Pseudomonadota bacterium]